MVFAVAHRESLIFPQYPVLSTAHLLPSGMTDLFETYLEQQAAFQHAFGVLG